MILTQKDLRIRLQNIGTYFLDRMLCVGSRCLGLGLFSKKTFNMKQLLQKLREILDKK